jgi:hypothetical protein
MRWDMAVSSASPRTSALRLASIGQAFPARMAQKEGSER